MSTQVNNIFFVNRSEITDRLDPLMAQYNKGLRSFNYDLVSLKSLLLQAPQYGANESGVERKKAEEVRYIRITDIDENGLLKQDSLGATAINIEDRFILQKDDILFARSGNTVGKAYIHKEVEKSIFAGYMIRYVVDRRKVLADFIFTYTQLKPYKDWVRSVQRAAGQPNINAEEYKSLQIPLPPFDVQTVIVGKINNAYNHKQQKDAQAKALLDGIDDYLCRKLEIKLPIQNNDVLSRMNIVHSHEIANRLDSHYYMERYYNIDLAIKQSAFDSKKIADVLCRIIRPFKPSERGEYRYIQLGSIGRNSTEILSTIDISLPNIPSRAKHVIKQGDILFSNANPQWGVHIIVSKEYDNCIASSGFDIYTSNGNNVYFIEVLRSSLYKELYKKYLVGAGLFLNITIRSLYSIRIPVPPIEIQNEIANHISEIRAKAKQLQQEGAAILSAAKAEVERMILG